MWKQMQVVFRLESESESESESENVYSVYLQ